MDNLISLFWVCWTWKFFPRYYWLGCLVTDRFGIRTSLTPILVKCKRFTGLFRLCMAYRSCKFYLRQKLHRSKVNYFSSCSQLDFDCVWNRKDVSNRLVTSCIGSNFYRDHRIGCVHGVHVGEIWHNLCNKGKSLYRVSLLRYGLREHTLYLCQSELVLLYFNYLLFFFLTRAWTCALNTFTASVTTEKEGIIIMTSHLTTCTTLGSSASLKSFTESIDRWPHITWEETEE